MLNFARHNASAVLLATPVLAALASAGCLATHRGPAVPLKLQDESVVPGLTQAARTWGDAVNPAFGNELKRQAQCERAANSLGPNDPLPPADVLAISGGGPNGAFAAGILNGWTKAGSRPEFRVVTGVSTGALIAPFAFIGPEYDHVIREFYTGISTEDVMRSRGLFGLFEDAIADSGPLRSLVQNVVTKELVERIAAEHEKGRILVVGTSNLDAQRTMLWNIGVIATSEHPDALGLIQNILMASAAVPAAFPPVLIDVEAGGQPYQELHVDGGVLSHVFLYPPSYKPLELERRMTAYVIQNAHRNLKWGQTKRTMIGVASRALPALLHSQQVGQLFEIYLIARRDGLDFNLATIPSNFKVESKELFDKKYMNALYDLGYQQALNGYPWLKHPPGLEP